jgi:hypothetical protein
MLECANLLLDAGDAVIDVSWERDRTGIGILCERYWTFRGTEALLEETKALVRRLRAAGGDLDALGGGQQLPPVVAALRSLNQDAAHLLIELGARTDDEHLVRPQSEKQCAMRGLVGEARLCGGEKAAARIIELQMRLCIAEHSAPDVEQPAPRRRLKAV